jgi:hypothetical protein
MRGAYTDRSYPIQHNLVDLSYLIQLRGGEMVKEEALEDISPSLFLVAKQCNAEPFPFPLLSFFSSFQPSSFFLLSFFSFFIFCSSLSIWTLPCILYLYFVREEDKGRVLCTVTMQHDVTRLGLKGRARLDKTGQVAQTISIILSQLLPCYENDDDCD